MTKFKMKHRVLAFMLCLAMVFGDASTVFAAEPNTGSNVIQDTTSQQSQTGDEQTGESQPEESSSEIEETVTEEETTTEEETVTEETTTEEETDEEETLTEVGVLDALAMDGATAEDSPIVATYTPANSSTEPIYADTFDEVMEGIQAKIDDGTISDNYQVRVTLKKDIEISANTLNRTTNWDKKIFFELWTNGHTITVPEDATICGWTVRGKSEDNTVDTDIVVAKDKTLTVIPTDVAGNLIEYDSTYLDCGMTSIECVNFVFDETSTEGGLVIGKIYQDDNKTVNASLTELFAANITGLSTPVKFYGNVEIFGESLDEDIYVENVEGQSCLSHVSLAGKSAEINGTLAMSGNMEYEKIIAHSGKCIELSGTVYLKGLEVVKEDGDPDCGLIIDLQKTIDNTQDYTFQGRLICREPVTKAAGLEKTISFKKSFRVIDDWSAENPYKEVPFEDGDIVANFYEWPQVTSSDIFGLLGGDGLTLVREGSDLKVTGSSVRVEMYDSITGQNQTREYNSFMEAVAGLTTDFGGAEAEYSFVFLKDTKLESNITIPAFVKYLNLRSEEIGHEDTENGNQWVTDKVVFTELDFNNFSMTTSSAVTIREGLCLTDNTGKNASTFTINAVEGEDGRSALYVEGIADTAVSIVDAEGNECVDRNPATEDSLDVVRNTIKVNVPKGCVTLDGRQTDHWLAFDPLSLIANRLNVQSGFWTTDVVSVNDLWVNGAWRDEEQSVDYPEAKVTFEHLNVSNGVTEIVGSAWVFKTLTLDGAKLFIDQNGCFNVSGMEVKSAYAYDASGNYTIENRGCLSIAGGGLSMPACTLYNEGILDMPKGTLKVTGAGTVRNHGTMQLGTLDMAGGSFYNTEGSQFITDNFTQASACKTYLDVDSMLVINNAAKIYNAVIGGEYDNGTEGCACVYRMPGSSVAFEGSVTRVNKNSKLGFGVLDTEGVSGAVGLKNILGENEKDYSGLAFVDGRGNKLLELGANPIPLQALTPLQPTGGKTILFTTAIKSFPVDYVQILQNEGNQNQYTSVYQQGTNICVGADWIVISAKSVDGEDADVLKTFTQWADAAAYLDSLSNASMHYIVEFTEDIDIEGALTLPKSAASVTFRGPGEDSKVTLIYTGNLSLTTDTTFENLDLIETSGGSVVNLNGKNLDLVNTNATFKSVTGKATSSFTVSGKEDENRGEHGIDPSYPTKVNITGAITTLDTLEVFHASLTVGQSVATTKNAISAVKNLVAESADLNISNGKTAITGNASLIDVYVALQGDTSVAGTLVMADSTLDGNGMMTFKDVVSLDDKNTIGTVTAGKIKITGTIYGPEADSDYSQYYGETEALFKEATNDYELKTDTNKDTQGTWISVRKSAISIRILACDPNGYTEDTVLLTGDKVQPEWFVVGSKESSDGRTGFGAGAHKKGTTIYYGAADYPVIMKQVYEFDEAGQPRDSQNYGRYETLQDAFDEIDRIGDSDATYLIELTADVDFLNTKNQYLDIKTPSKAGYIVITSADETPKTITYKQKFTLQTYVKLQNINLAPQTSANSIALNNYWLELFDSEILSETTSVAGSGVAKDSGLSVVAKTDESEITLSSLVNVGGLYLENATVYVHGTTNIGDVEINGSKAKLYGTAQVTRSTKGEKDITKIVPAITINGRVFTDGHNLTIGLLEKSGTEYVPIDFYSNVEDDGKLLADGIQLAKAPNVSSNLITASSDNIGVNNSGIMTKTGGYLTYRDGEFGVILVYDVETGDVDENGEPITETMETWCRTFAEAVAEINNLKTKRDYTILLLEETATISEEAPAVLSMPNKNYVNSLYITGWNSDDALSGETVPVTLNYLGNITLSTPTTLGDVDFVQVDKNTKVPVDELMEDYPSPISFSTAGNDLFVEGKVTFNTPVNFAGVSKESLSIENGGLLYTNTNAEGDPQAENVIFGCIKKFNNVYVKTGQALTLKEYCVSSRYTAPQLDVINLYADGDVNVGMPENQAYDAEDNSTIHPYASLKSTNTYINGGRLTIFGDAALTNVVLSGNGPSIFSTRKFTISGTLTNTSENADLVSCRQGDGKAPYLTISGKVVLENAKKHRIRVGVMNAISFDDLREGRFEQPILGTEETGEYPAPSTYTQLLTAKNATADMFIPAQENVGVLEFGSKDEGGNTVTGGWILAKTKENIYVYYGDEVEAALCAGEVADGKLENADVLGYYPSYNDAVAALDAKNDTSAEYTILLLQDVDDKTTAENPVTLSMPKKASKVTVTSAVLDENDEDKNIYLTGNLALGTNMEFKNVTFCPKKKSGKSYVGTVFNITNGAFEVALTDVALGTENGMALGSITGNGKAGSSVVLNANGLLVSGAVTKQQKLDVQASAEVKGNVQATEIWLYDYAETPAVNAVTLTLSNKNTFTTDKLVMRNAELDASAGGAVKVKDVEAYKVDTNSISYGTGKDNVPNLTITGEITLDGCTRLCLDLKNPNADTGYYTLEAGTTISLKKDKKLSLSLATIEKEFLSKVQMELNGTDVSSAVVKANKGVYLTDEDSGANKVKVSGMSRDPYSYCLDMKQAAVEINNRKQPDSNYIIELYADITDTDVTDTVKVSPLTLPNENMAEEITIASGIGAGFGMETYSVSFSGDISYKGKLALNILNLEAMDKTGTSHKDFSITLNKKDARLVMNYVTTDYENADGETVQGYLNKTDAPITEISYSTLYLKAGITADQLHLSEAYIVTGGITKVRLLSLAGQCKWDSLGKTTVTDIVAPDLVNVQDCYIASKPDAKGVPQFIVNGTVGMVEQVPLPVKVFNTDTDTDVTLENYVAYGEEGYDDQYVNWYSGKDGKEAVGLVVAPKESADKFIAYNFRINPYDSSMVFNEEGMTTDNLACYKDLSNIVRNDKDDNMAAMITKDDSRVTYAKSFEEAVKIIDAMNDTAASYEITLLQKDGTVEAPTEIKTAKNGNEYGALTLPSKAASVTIKGQKDGEGNPTTVIRYTGTLQPKCNVTFDDILLTEGTVDKKTSGFIPTNAITPAIGKSGYTLRFGENAATLKADEETNEKASDAKLVFTSVSGTKGTLELVTGQKVYVKGTFAVEKLSVGEDVILTADKAVTITDIVGNDANPILTLDICFTDKGLSQLTINGTIDTSVVRIAPRIYDTVTKSYRRIRQAEAEALVVTDASKAPATTQKMATVPKAICGNVMLMYDSGELYQLAGSPVRSYKQDGGLYFTTLEPVVRLQIEGNSVPTQFLSWEQAVKEIDRIAKTDASYTLILLDDIGSKTPITEMIMPSKAAKVTVKSEDGENNSIYFTKAAITLKCNTVFDGIGLMAVKKMGKAPATWYESISYNITIGNFSLTEKNMRRSTNNAEMDYARFESMPGILSGTAKGSFTFKQCDTSANQGDFLDAPATKITGVGNVTFLNRDESTGIPTAGTDGEGNPIEDNNARNNRRTWLSVSGGISGVGELTLWPDVELNSSADVSVKNLTLAEGSNFNAKNLTVSATTTLKSSTIYTGTDIVGDGKVNLKDVVLESGSNYIGVKQDKKGESQLTINGMVTKADNYVSTYPGDNGNSSVCVGLHYNNSSENYAKLYNGMTLLTAPKADSEWFSPDYSWKPNEELGEHGDERISMGYWLNGYGLYKSGKTIKYGKTEDMEALLIERSEDGAQEIGRSTFATFEEAVKEIDARSNTKASYTIELCKNVEIGNEKGDGQYKALTLPTKLGTLTIDGRGNQLLFSGNVTLKSNLFLQNVDLQPRKFVKGEAVPTKANYNIGKYTLEIFAGVSSFAEVDGEGMSLVGNISGTAKSGLLYIAGDKNDTGDVELFQFEVDNITGNIRVEIDNHAKLRVNGNCTADVLAMVTENDSESVSMNIGGKLTVNEIRVSGRNDGMGMSFIRKEADMDMIVNGNKTTQEAISVSSGSEAPTRPLTIYINQESCAPGTKVMTGNYLGTAEELSSRILFLDGKAYPDWYVIYKNGNDVMIGNVQQGD